MSIRVMQSVWEHSKQSGGALVLLLAIADNAHDDGDGAYPSNSTLAKKARMTGRNVNMLIKKLEDDGEIAVRHGAGPNGVNVYRVLLPGLSSPENISPLKTFHPEKKSTGGVKKSAGGGEKAGTQGVKPTSPKPSVNHHTEPSIEPSEVPRVPRTPRITLDTYSPSEKFLDWVATEFPWMAFDTVLDNWRDHHRSRGTSIKDFDASLRVWLRNERRPSVSVEGGKQVSNATAKWDRTMATIMDFNPPERKAR